MNEDLLSYIWRLKLFDHHDLRTTSGEDLKIIDPGYMNRDAGPDFSGARLRINETVWAGSIELHVKASDWLRHKHEQDPAYDNVILHVVYENDLEIPDAFNKPIPTLRLSDRIENSMIERFQYLSAHNKFIPCSDLIRHVPSHIISSCLERNVVERLELQSHRWEDALNMATFDWSEVMYQKLSRSLGIPANNDPFESLARAAPYKFLVKHRTNLKQLEAILFGQAGMLNRNFVDKYPKELQMEYAFLKNKYNLKPIAFKSWHLLRMHPLNFPTLRIAQLAKLIHQTDRLTSALLSARTPFTIRSLLNVAASEYWNTHYLFDQPAKYLKKNLGGSKIDTIIINAVVPYKYTYGKLRVDDHLINEAIGLLLKLPAEQNKLVRKYKQVGLEIQSSFDSQGALQLYRNYCSLKKCTQCAIGHRILKGERIKETKV